MQNGIEQALEAIKAAIKSSGSSTSETSQTAVASIDTSDRSATATPQQTDLASISAKATSTIPDPEPFAPNDPAPSIPDPHRSLTAEASSISPTLSSTAATLHILHNQKLPSPHSQSREISIPHESAKSVSIPPSEFTPPKINLKYMDPDLHGTCEREIFIRKKLPPGQSKRFNQDTNNKLTTAPFVSLDVPSKDVSSKDVSSSEDISRDDQNSKNGITYENAMPSVMQRLSSDGPGITHQGGDASQKNEPLSAERNNEDAMFAMDEFEPPPNRPPSP